MNAVAGAALRYVAIVFGTGFALGLVRVPLLVPRLGVRWAELLEMPLMGLAMFFAADHVRRRWPALRSGRELLAVGVSALALLVGAELLLGVLVLGRTPWQVVADRDPVSGPVYAVMLVVFALLPWWLGRRRPGVRR